MSYRLVTLAASAAFLLAGCNEAFDPFVENPDGLVLTGFLDARADTQFVRLQPIAELETVPRLGETRLTSTPLGGGAPRAWADSVVVLGDGSTGLLFLAAFQPRVGITYRLEARRADGVTETVDVPMPVEPVLDPRPRGGVGGVITQRLVLETDVRPSAVRVTYTARRVGGTAEEIVVVSEALPVFGGAGFDVLVELSRDAVRVRGTLGAAADEPVELLGVRLRYDLVDPDRVAGQDGLGSVGVAAAFESGWVLDPETVDALGYIDGQGGER